MEKNSRFLTSRIMANLMLLMTALLWGSSYSFRKMGLLHMTPFFFNFLRFFVAFLFIFAILVASGRVRKGYLEKLDIRTHVKGGFYAGTALAFAAAIQQWALLSTTAGKVGFITSLYTVFVPIVGIVFFNTRVKRQIWIAAASALIGLFLISSNKDLTIIPGDIAALVSALIFGFHIHIVGRYAEKTDGLYLSSFQMLFGCGWNFVFAALLERGNTFEGVIQGAFPILYTGIFPIGLSFMLQIFAQKRTAASVAAIIMSLESVFAVLFGALILSEKMSMIQIIGCAFIFAAVLIAQLGDKR